MKPTDQKGSDRDHDLSSVPTETEQGRSNVYTLKNILDNPQLFGF